MSKVKDYDERLLVLQTALVKAQAWAIEKGLKVLIVLEGRDAAGKDGAIKRITEYASGRKTRVVSLPKPTERELGEWWFQRYVAQLPAAGELVVFNRSWYNRGGVERVMGFCIEAEQEDFMDSVSDWQLRRTRGWLDVPFAAH